MDVRERFLRAIDHIEAHLLEPVRLADAAKRAGLAPAYFSRLFRVLTGEPFGAYLRRRRLTVAAKRLTNEPDVRLIDLALDCRYDSQEAFTRAFKRAFGVPPGAYRKDPPRLDVGFRHPIDALTLDHLKEVVCMEPRILEIPPFVVVGVRERFDSESRRGIPALWDRFLPRIPEVAERADGRSYGVCLNADPEDGSFDYLAGVPVRAVDRLPEGLVAETLPRQTYAVFTHTMKTDVLHDELQPTIRWIWSTWLPASPHAYAPGPDFERYPEAFEMAPGSTIEICVPVVPDA